MQSGSVAHYDAWVCPICAHSLTRGLACVHCDFIGYARNGLLYLHGNNADWQKCLHERHGWIELTREIGLYRENDDHFFLPDRRPHLSEVFGESKRHIDKLMAIESLEGKVCVDLGAWIGWVEAYILKKYRDAMLIALDINDDPLVGLGRSVKLKDHFQCAFISLVADMHHLPFADDSIDIVFSVDALHHFRDLSGVMAQIARVLKRGGRFYGLNEPDRPCDTMESDFISQHITVEIKHGIIERRPTIEEYLDHGRMLNLRACNDDVGLRKNIDTCGLFLRGEKT